MMKTFIAFMLILFQTTFLFAQDKDYSEWYLQREDVDIFVKELGAKKDTVIVVHGGFGANHDYMIDAIKGLKNKFHFVLYDQRGSLLSPTGKENLTFQKNVEDLYELTKALKLKKVKLLCHSMGTLIGMEFTKQHPSLVTNLVLTGALIPKSDSLQSVFSKRQKSQVNVLMNRKEVRKHAQPYKDKGIDSLKSIKDIERSRLTHKDLTGYWRLKFAAVNIYDITKTNLLKGGRAYYKPEASAMSETVNWDYDYRNSMNDNTKTMIINGAFDFLDFDGKIYHSLIKGYPNIQLNIIPDAGHNAWIDKPRLFEEYLVKGLE
ncbi:MAG: alpha/beta hydrolase [Flavobacteriaceae bacterium]|nr:alpha/beta hydrolase [Flavobacteriaceae bacterium]